MSGMTKTERDELRRLVRQRSKVLRDEVKARTAELAAEVEQTLVARFYERDQKRLEAERAIQTVIDEANGKIMAVLDGVDYQVTGVGRSPLPPAHIRWDTTDRIALRMAAIRDIEARAAAAVLQLSRQEVDLLEKLARGALASEDALAFLASIPTVGELVPSVRMEELERAIDDTPGNDGMWL